MIPFLKLRREFWVIYAIVFLFILIHPYSVENPTIPDERAYFEWSHLYMQGNLAVKLQDWIGINYTKDVISDGQNLIYLYLNTTIKNRTVTVNAYLSTGKTVEGVATIKSRNFVLRKDITNGVTVFHLKENGIYMLDCFEYTYGLHAHIIIGVNFSQPYHTYFEFIDHTIYAHDSVGMPLENAEVWIQQVSSHTINNKKFLGYTDEQGMFTLNLTPGKYIISVYKKPKAPQGMDMRLTSLVKINGEYYVVNRWPPGYSFLLIPFIALHLEIFVTLILSFFSSITVYKITEMLFGEKYSLISSSLYLTSAIALLAVYTRGMADYTSMAFIVFSLYFFVKYEKYEKISYALISGIFFGVAVCIRYTAITILIAPIFFYSYKIYKIIRFSGEIRKNLIKIFRKIFPLIVSLLIPLILLAYYNATFFGSPFSTGYMYGSDMKIENLDGNITVNISKRGFYSNFNPIKALPTIPLRLLYLFIVMPVIYIGMFSFYRNRKNMWIVFLFIALLGNFLLYMFVPWVGSWSDVTRSIEDMRYFLPSLPFSAIISSLFIEKMRNKKVILAIVIILGFIIGEFAISLHLLRVIRPPPPPKGY